MIDILLDENFDLQIENGDLVLGDPTQQNIELLCATVPGQWKENPTAGMALVNLLNSEVTEVQVKHFMNIQLRADGAKLKSLSFNNDEINIDASYED